MTTEMRLILLSLGLLLVACLYFIGRSGFRFSFKHQRFGKFSDRARSTEEPIDTTKEYRKELVTERVEPKDRAEEKPLVIRVVPRDREFAMERVVLALHEAGLKQGKYDIFHFFHESLLGDVLFSVANLREPGVFDLTGLKQEKIPGLSFFLMLPGPTDPLGRFDRMVETARWIAEQLDADLLDERGSSWSTQREHYLREEIVEYCQQFNMS
ncbi:MAG: cell division protein ZipA C-terminal FtsZ-binding domain-containing protein [Pseudomonadota bacterium]|nr:cell division protein ZipA C-terminal FtsZ-binding domain-containing protein [Pseudomonadota bacterium]